MPGKLGGFPLPLSGLILATVCVFRHAAMGGRYRRRQLTIWPI